MAIEVDDLLHEALALPDAQRAALAVDLLASLDPPASEDPAAVQADWSEELARRAKRVMAGDQVGEDWATIRGRLAAELAG